MIVIESFEYVNVPTENLEKSIEFYTMFLDFDTVEQGEGWAILNFEAITICLRHTPGATADSQPNLVGNLPLLSFLLDVDDFTDALQEIEANEIPLVAGPAATSSGESVHLLDPGGNLLEFAYRDEK